MMCSFVSNIYIPYIYIYVCVYVCMYVSIYAFLYVYCMRARTGGILRRCLEDEDDPEDGDGDEDADWGEEHEG